MHMYSIIHLKGFPARIGVNPVSNILYVLYIETYFMFSNDINPVGQQQLMLRKHFRKIVAKMYMKT
jgi:hypothetical protein